MDKIEQLHKTYCQETGLGLSLSVDRRHIWEDWLRYGLKQDKRGWDENTLRQVIRYLKKDKNRTLAYLKFRWLIGSPDYFSEDLAEARAAYRQKRFSASQRQTMRGMGYMDPQEYESKNNTVTAKHALAGLTELKNKLGKELHKEELPDIPT